MSKLDKFIGLSSLAESVGRRNVAAPASAGSFSLPPEQIGRDRAKDVWMIDLDRIVPDPDQPRKEFEADAIERLAASLQTKGQLQPIQVRWDAGLERFVVLMGERRWRAAHAAGLVKLQCVVREATLSDDERLSLQVIENCLREDLKPIEQARAFQGLMARQGWTQEQLASELAVSRTIVVRALSLLKLPEPVQAQVEQGGLTPSAAHELAKLDDPAEQIRLAEATVKHGLTHKDVVAQVRRPQKKTKAVRVPSAVVLRVQGFRLEISRKTGVPRNTVESVLVAALEQIRNDKAGDEGQEAA